MKKLIYSTLTVLLFIMSQTAFAQNPGDSTDVYGCMDTSATNYNPLATIDNGYCMYYCDSTTAYFWISSANDSLVTIQNYAYSPAGITSYTWDFGDGNTSELENPTFTYSETGVYTICLTVTAPGEDLLSECTNTFCDSIYVSEGTTVNIVTVVYGCTDPDALNYNPLATIDDWSCFYPNDTITVYGCTDPGALNYNPAATMDDGSCDYGVDTTLFDIYGCMDPLAINYNFLATVDDGSCIYDNDSTGTDIFGCMDPMALNYNFLATVDDGSCIYENDTTIFDIYGCMDTSALNYNPMATMDDGSCMYYCDSTYAYFSISDVNIEDGIITVINSSGSIDPISSYLWDFGDGTSSTEEFPTHVYTSDGFYMLCLTITAATPSGNLICTSTYCDTIGITLFGVTTDGFTLNVVPEISTGIEDKVSALSEINLYPNPANENITLSFNLEKSDVLTTTIYDISGRVIKTWTANTASGFHQVPIGISDLSPGMYQIELRNNDSRNIKRFQVIK